MICSKYVWIKRELKYRSNKMKSREVRWMVSVIVPVYNAEKYLEKCIESIRSQTYAHLDIILVNDGSTDSSLDICRNQ